MRTAASLILVAGLVASLAACSTSPNPAPTASCTPTASGSVSDSVTVTGDFGAKPKVTVKAPTAVPATQRTVAIKGTGPTAVAGDTVNVDFTLVDGTTGTELTGSQYSGATTALPIDDKQLPPGLIKTMQCSAVGSRVVGVIPPADAYGATGNTQLGVKANEDIVFVVDIVSIAPPVVPALKAPDGADQPATPGFPTVATGADGTPTVTIPDGAPPADLKIALLKKGTHAVIKDGDNVVVNYVGVNWNTKKVFDSSFARGATATFKTSAVIPGFTAALVGQAVGSRVIVVIPPDKGYGAAGSPPDIGGTDTLVFVIDILGIG